MSKGNFVVKFDLFSRDGINSAIRALNEYEAWLTDRSHKLLERLAREGYNVASYRFAWADYDGQNDVDVTVEDRGPTAMAVVALGAATLFIEFGTGLLGPMHPETPPGLERGSWSDGPNGKHHWDDPNGWFYAHGTKSYGNGANMPMYESVKEIEQNFRRYVEEIFV